MFNYLRAIGFSNIREKSQIDNLLGEVMTTPDKRIEKCYNNNEKFVEMIKMFSDNIGIIIRGYYDNKSFFHLEDYCPFISNNNVSISEEIYFNKKLDSMSYICLCDDIKLGVALIFYLQNVVDYVLVNDKLEKDMEIFRVGLSGLSYEGKILLPVIRNENNKIKYIKNKKSKLMMDAIKGDKEAIDKIVLNDIDMHNHILERTKNEDIYTIVENTFYPCGESQDCYSIIGTIKDIKISSNCMSNEKVYIMLVDCKDISINICINDKDLVGVPMIGARFKGKIWLQGYVDFGNV